MADRSVIGSADWSDWRWQLRAMIRDAATLALWALLPSERLAAVDAAGRGQRWGLTPYYASLIDPADPACPIARQALPALEESADSDDPLDPLGETARQPAPGLYRQYPDRVAWCVTGACPIHCRHCFRKHYRDEASGPGAWDAALAYIAADPTLRDVLVTGGDPLMLADETLDGLLRRLRSIPHVEIVRIGTRCPVALPMRVTPDLCAMLARHHPVYLNTQFNHPRELTPEARAALARLADAGIPLGNQSVLLRGVNDDPAVMRQLVHELLKARVRPYYLFHPNLLRGVRHLRVSLDQGLAVMRALEGFTSGLGVPMYILDTPFGKTPLTEGTILRREAGRFVVRTFRGEVWTEPDEAAE